MCRAVRQRAVILRGTGVNDHRGGGSVMEEPEVPPRSPESPATTLVAKKNFNIHFFPHVRATNLILHWDPRVVLVSLVYFGHPLNICDGNLKI